MSNYPPLNDTYYQLMQLRPVRDRPGDSYDHNEILPLEEYPPELPSNHIIVPFTSCDMPIDELLNWANTVLSFESILPLNLRRRSATSPRSARW